MKERAGHGATPHRLGESACDVQELGIVFGGEAARARLGVCQKGGPIPLRGRKHREARVVAVRC